MTTGNCTTLTADDEEIEIEIFTPWLHHQLIERLHPRNQKEIKTGKNRQERARKNPLCKEVSLATKIKVTVLSVGMSGETAYFP